MGDTNEPSFTAKYAKYANKVLIFFRPRFFNFGFLTSDFGFWLGRRLQSPSRIVHPAARIARVFPKPAHTSVAEKM